MRKTVLLICVAWAMITPSKAQKLLRTYYDYNHTKVKEEYSTNEYGIKTGAYKFYSEFGGILVQGAYKNDKLVGKWTTKDEKGVLLADESYDNEGNFNGTCIYYKDGHKNYVKVYVHGVKNGNWKTWYSTDDSPGAYNQLYYDENYKQNQLDSVWTEYAVDGRIVKQCHYSRGVLNGDNIVYGKNGQAIIKEYYLNGNLDGECIYYADDGSGEILAKGVYKDGKKSGTWRITYDSQGNITTRKTNAEIYRIINYTDGGIGWKATDYYMTGEKQGEETLIAINPDVMVGTVSVYYKSGGLKERGRFNSNGKLDSLLTEYYENGKPSSVARYNNGAIDSIFTEYYDNGTVFAKGECKASFRIGVWKIFDKTGNLIYMHDYSDITDDIGHCYKNGQETYQLTSGENEYANVWPWPNTNLLNMVNEHTQ